MMLLGFDHKDIPSRRLAEALNIPRQIIQRHRFPDGEIKLTLPETLPDEVIMFQSLNQPNEKLLELLLAASTARNLGAQQLTLVAPYLCYMRQDMAFHPGEAISQPIIGRFLAQLFDNVITVDPHLHRIQHLSQAVPATRAVALSATSLMTDYLGEHHNNPVLIGPDSESGKWVEAVARPHNWTFGVCEKARFGDREVEIRLPQIPLHGRSVVIVDDVASSGQTLAVATEQCLRQKAAQVDVMVTHALFANDARQRLKRAGVGHIWSTDSIPHASNVIPLCELLKEAILNLKADSTQINHRSV